MLIPFARGARVVPLERLEPRTSRPAAQRLDWETPIDRSRWFVCESITPLYYTKSYQTLAPEHRLRYNHLTGMLSNELILRLETGLLDCALSAVAGRAGSVGNELIDAVRRFRDDERRHAELWRRLNRLSEPAWYGANDRHLVRVPAFVERFARTFARHPATCSLVFWVQLAQEERSIEISRRCLRLPAGSIEPRYAAVYGQHLRDEVTHVQIDCHLIERFHARQSRLARQTTATTFRWVLSRLFLRPARSTVRVIDVLASEYEELRPLVPDMRRQLHALVEDAAYQEMMYSRKTTPVTFALFDAFPEFHSMRSVLRAYTPSSALQRR